MGTFVKMKQYGRAWPVAAVCALAGFGAGAAASSMKMIVTPFQDAKFVAMDPSMPDAAAMAVLRGNPATGPSTMLLKMKKAEGSLHIHASDYDLVLLQGTMKHWGKGQREADLKPLGPGSYWFQPGKHPHGDSCLSDECLMFIAWAGRR